MRGSYARLELVAYEVDEEYFHDTVKRLKTYKRIEKSSLGLSRIKLVTKPKLKGIV